MSTTLALLVALVGCKGDDTPVPEITAPVVDDGNVHDDLSMPQQPTLDPGDFESAQTCQFCHPSHYEEWRTSMHAYAMVDPVFQALVSVRQQDLAGTEDQFCTQCHSAIGTRGGEIGNGFSFDELSPIVMEGITCEACHKVTDIARDYNSGHVIDGKAPMQGPISDPTASSFHESEGSPLFESSEFCGACHDVIETSGLDLERPYKEWLESPSAEEGQTCQECHMPLVERSPATGVAPRPVREHRWVGVDVPLLDGWVTEEEEDELKTRISELLETAADLDLSAPTSVAHGQTFDVTVTATNKIAAHNLPTGSTFLRQLWVELTATDANGTVLYVTGDLDANGDLRDYWSELDPYGDHDLPTLHSGFVDQHGNPTIFPWAASEHNSNALSPLYDRTWTLFIPTDAAVASPITVESRLRFRSIGPYVLRLVGMGDKVDEIDIHDLATDTVQVELTP